MRASYSVSWHSVQADCWVMCSLCWQCSQYLCDCNSFRHLGILNAEWASSTNAFGGVLCTFLFNGGCGGDDLKKNKCLHVENLRERG